MLALGSGKERDEPRPKKLVNKKMFGVTVETVSAGGQHSAILATRAASQLM